MADFFVTTSGNDTTGDGSSGNPWATPGKACSEIGVSISSGDRIGIQSGTYTLTTSTPGAGGPAVIPDSVDIEIHGYASTIGDLGTAPILDAGAQTSVTLWDASASTIGNDVLLSNLRADGNSGASNIGFKFATHANAIDRAYSFGRKLRADDCPDVGFQHGWQSLCEAYGCGVGFELCRPTWCMAGNNTSHGFDLVTGGAAAYEWDLWGLFAYGNGGSGIYTIGGSVGLSASHGNTGDGYESEFSNTRYKWCVPQSNGGYGFNSNLAGRRSLLTGCYHRNNTSGSQNTTSREWFTEGLTALTADPFTDAANGDFSLNSAAGGGAVLRAVTETLGGTAIYPFLLLTTGAGGGGGTSGKLVGIGGGLVG